MNPITEYYEKHYFNPNMRDRAMSEDESVYLILNEKDKSVKIGKSNNAIARFRALSNQSGQPLTLLFFTMWPEVNYDESSHYLELFLHRYFKNKRVKGEWFQLDKKDIWQTYNFIHYDLEIECSSKPLLSKW